MKKLAVLLGAFAVTASAATYYELAGEFAWDHQVVFMNYADKAECEADKGTWEEDLGCLFDTQDTVTVSRDLTTVNLETISTNGHSCVIEAEVVAIEPDSVVAQTPAEEYDEESGEFKPVTCEVTVDYSADKDTVYVGSKNCQSFCGARGIPWIDEAKRTGKF